MLRVDPTVMPTMAKAPTLGEWELELLRRVERVVRLGHVEGVDRRGMTLLGGSVAFDPSSLVVHCAASGLQNPPMVPIWTDDAIRLQTIRAGVPCFAAALAGFVEATRDDDRERNRLCPPNLYGDTLADWTRMQARGTRAAATFGAEPDIAAWAGACALNPARVTAAQRDDPAVQRAAARLADVREPGLACLTQLGAGSTAARSITADGGP
jgi:hypothetical protein